ncbi:TetR/AcrR family transcriptional regulator C-terminal domain-containing protein [Geodermatophilus sp. SYSU D01062]
MPISRDDVVRAAVEVLDDEGLAGLTLRGVAARLGVSAPTLYWHVKDKRHLLDLVADSVMAEVPESTRAPRPGEPVWEWLAEASRVRRALLLAHRDSVQVVAGNRPTEVALPGIERTLRVLVEAGLEPGEAVRVVTALGSFVLGDALETQTALDRPAGEPAGGSPDDPGRFPTLTAAVPTAGGDEERFEEGLALFLDGLRARLERRARARRGAALGAPGPEVERLGPGAPVPARD